MGGETKERDDEGGRERDVETAVHMVLKEAVYPVTSEALNDSLKIYFLTKLLKLQIISCSVICCCGSCGLVSGTRGQYNPEVHTHEGATVTRCLDG